MSIRRHLLLAAVSVLVSMLVSSGLLTRSMQLESVHAKQRTHYRAAKSPYTPTPLLGPTPFIDADHNIVDRGKMTDSWLWLLSEARNNGWRGMVKGPLSGLRSWEQQNELYQLYLSGKGAPAFNPDGPSRHLSSNVDALGEWAQAVDVTHAKQLISVAEDLGISLHQPYPAEPWHVEALQPF